MRSVDLNCDLGEGRGDDTDIMPLLTSANIACGGHAGDAASMQTAVALARRHSVAVGAHPGFPDRENFGRRRLTMAPDVLQRSIEAQIRELRAYAPLRHVKPHGALYNLAAGDAAIAGVVVAAVRAVAADSILFAPWGSELARVAAAHGLRVAYEVFADRGYRADGSLVPRGDPGALIADEDAMAVHVLRMVGEGRVRAADGREIPIQADTVCVHGDGQHALAFARRLRLELERAGVPLRPPFT